MQMKKALCCLLLLATTGLNASKRDSEASTLAKYLARVQTGQPAAPALSLGSIWVDSGRMASLSADYKAMNVGDLIEIVVVQGLTSSNANSVATARTFNTSSGISSLPGKIKVGGVSSLLGLNSSEILSGKGAASTATNVTTNLSGRVVAVLPSGNLVVEAERIVNMNNEKQTIVLGRTPGRHRAEQHGRFRLRWRTGTGNQRQRRGLGRGAPAAQVVAHRFEFFEFLGASFL
jgi:flagellar basal body L-ring protein FlgH